MLIRKSPDESDFDKANRLISDLMKVFGLT